jgi:hypothetical protein
VKIVGAPRHHNTDRAELAAGVRLQGLVEARAAARPARLRERAFDCIDAGDLGALRPACVLCRGRPPEGED